MQSQDSSVSSRLSNLEISPPPNLNKLESSGSSNKERKDPRGKKKSSWFNQFYPTYKSRSGDFKRIFKEVPDDERLVVGEFNIDLLNLYCTIITEPKYHLTKSRFSYHNPTMNDAALSAYQIRGGSGLSNVIRKLIKKRCQRQRDLLKVNITKFSDYSCALQKEILVQGRLYVTQNYLCFYANIFGWETTVTLKWKDVSAITKEKTAIVIPNAVLICTRTEKYFFTSFVARDKTYLMLFRVWQNALMDQPMTPQEMWQWVRSNYSRRLTTQQYTYKVFPTSYFCRYTNVMVMN